jgi:hypothetical protein
MAQRAEWLLGNGWLRVVRLPLRAPVEGSSAAFFKQAVSLHEFLENRPQVIMEIILSHFCFVPSPCYSLLRFPVSNASAITNCSKLIVGQKGCFFVLHQMVSFFVKDISIY